MLLRSILQQIFALIERGFMQDFTEITREELLNKLVDVYLNETNVNVGIALETDKKSREFVKELRAKLSERKLTKAQKEIWRAGWLENGTNKVRVLARYNGQYFFAIFPAYFVTDQKTLEKFPEAVEGIYNTQACMAKHENYLIKD